MISIMATTVPTATAIWLGLCLAARLYKPGPQPWSPRDALGLVFVMACIGIVMGLVAGMIVQAILTTIDLALKAGRLL